MTTAASWAAARRSGCIAVSVSAGDMEDTVLLCAPCLRDCNPTPEEMGMIGPLRPATGKDLARCVCCSSCGADLAALVK